VNHNDTTNCKLLYSTANEREETRKGNRESRAASYESRATSHESRVTRHERRATQFSAQASPIAVFRLFFLAEGTTGAAMGWKNHKNTKNRKLPFNCKDRKEPRTHHNDATTRRTANCLFSTAN